MNKVGTNQYKRKQRFVDTWQGTLTIGFLIMVILGTVGVFTRREAIEQVYADTPIISPLAAPTPTPILKAETPEKQRIIAEIKEVFGEHADKAFKVLSCENSALNPEAVNTAGNVPAGSRDIGVFQINEYWQKVQGRFLFDPSINIRIAYEIFEANGYTFERWTCGRKLGV